MKRYLFPLIILLSQSIPVLSETWIYITGYYEDGIRFNRYIDISSVYEKGSWKYANMKRTMDDSEINVGIRLNCKQGIFLNPISDPDYNTVYFIQVRRIKNNYWVTDGMGIKRDKFVLEKTLPGLSEKKSLHNPEAEGSYKLLCKS